MKHTSPQQPTQHTQTTLVDTLGRPMQDLRISLTDRCNFNCVYCMPDKNITFLPQSEILTYEEIERLVQVLVPLGIRKVKLTGGEPTLRAGIDILIKKLVHIPQIEDIGLITNGYFLKNIGNRLKTAGLKRISISLDALDPRVFQSIVGHSHSIHPVLEGISYAEKYGFHPIKINCVIQRGINDDQILPLVRYFRKPHFQLRFIEFMDVGNIEWHNNTVVTSKEILDIISKHYPLTKMEAIYYGEVSSRYCYSDGQGEIGFISSVSNPFCHDCTRLRLSANGMLYGCLFTDKGLNVKTLIRNTSDNTILLHNIQTFWKERDDRYSEIRAKQQHTQKKLNMNFIGG